LNRFINTVISKEIHKKLTKFISSFIFFLQLRSKSETPLKQLCPNAVIFQIYNLHLFLLNLMKK